MKMVNRFGFLQTGGLTRTTQISKIFEDTKLKSA